MHPPVRRLLLFLISGFVLIGVGLALVLAMLLGGGKSLFEWVLVGLATMALGVVTVMVGLIRYAFRRPSVEELVGSSADESRSWHFTRFGLGYVLVMFFGYPFLVITEAEPRWLMYTIVIAGYTVFGLAMVVPRFKHVFFHDPLTNAEKQQMAADVQPKSVVDYYGPLMAFAFAGLAVGGLVMYQDAEPKHQPRAIALTAMGVVGFVISVVPKLRRRFLKPKHWRGD